MFSKKCSRCGNKIKKDFKYCPFCNKNLNSKHDKEDYGFLGKDDFVENPLPIAGFSDSFVDKMFNSAMKMLEKQMRNMNSEMNSPKQNGPQNPRQDSGLNVQFFVNGEKVFPEKQRRNFNDVPGNNLVEIKQTISKEKLKKFADLPRVEPKTTMKRLSGKLIYELAVPGVKEIDDVLINQLESSIEIKALSKTKVYSKNLNIKLPISRYGLENDNLIIELQTGQQ